MNHLPAIVKKVKFGTAEFMFLRTDINCLLTERNALKKDFERNKGRYIWIGETVRSLAGLVYFERSMHIKQDLIKMPAPDAYKKRRAEKRKGKKAVASTTYQKSLF